MTAAFGAAFFMWNTWLSGRSVTEPFDAAVITHPTSYVSWWMGHSVFHIASTGECAIAVVSVGAVFFALLVLAETVWPSRAPHLVMDALHAASGIASAIAAFLLGSALAGGSGVIAALCLLVSALVWWAADLATPPPFATAHDSSDKGQVSTGQSSLDVAAEALLEYTTALESTHGDTRATRGEWHRLRYRGLLARFRARGRGQE